MHTPLLLRRFVASLFFLLLSNAVASAWDGIGHMLVAQVAYDRLTPQAKAKLTALAHQIQFPGRTYDAITMSCWMDDIRSNREDIPFHGRYKTWHYIDIGLSPSDPTPSFTVTDPQQESYGNVVQALTRAVAVMKGGSDPLIPDQVTAAALIVHLVGDIHQPLHCATYDFPDTSKPKNDQGGNRVIVTDSAVEQEKTGPRQLNLHAFWDEAYRATFKDGQVDVYIMPLAQAHQAAETDPYKFNIANYAPGADVPLKADFEAWARESNQLARDDVYSALTFDATHLSTNLSADYVQKSSELAKKRIVLAGYRLADLLNDLLK